MKKVIYLTFSFQKKTPKEISVTPTCFSDHHLITSPLSFPKLQPIQITINYRNINKIHWELFNNDLYKSPLFNNNTNSSEEYDILLNNTIVTLLDNHAPIRTKTIRQSPFQRNQLSQKAIKARRFRRKMEKIYSKTLHIDDKSAYEAKNKARSLIMQDRIESIKDEDIKIGTPQQLNKFSSLSSINFGSTSIDLIKKLKVLGITIDEKLSFDYHITTVIRSCNHHLRALSHIRQFLTNNMASTLARCLVLSKLDYCNSHLYNITKHQQERLQRIMNKAARISLNINTPHHYLHHSSKNYFSQPHWLPVYNRIIFKIALITYKTYTTSIPGYLSNLIQNRPNPRLLRSSSATLLIKNSTTNKISERGFRHASPAVWNFLPPYIRNSPLLATFKSHLKTYLFRLFFNNI